jgi:hypothetical protein
MLGLDSLRHGRTSVTIEGYRSRGVVGHLPAVQSHAVTAVAVLLLGLLVALGLVVVLVVLNLIRWMVA